MTISNKKKLDLGTETNCHSFSLKMTQLLRKIAILYYTIVLLPFFRVHPSELVQEETFTHSPILIINHPLCASSIYCNSWHPLCSIYVPDSLFAQSLSKFSLVYPLVWHPPPHTSHIPHPTTILPSQHMAAPSQPTPSQHRNQSQSLSQLPTQNSILQSNATHPSDHSHRRLLRCHPTLSPTDQVSLPCNTPPRTQPLHNLPLTILIGKQWYQLPEFIPSNSNSGLYSCTIISIYTQHVPQITKHIC